MSIAMKRRPVAWSLLIALVSVDLLIHALSNGPFAWGYMTDELYFLDSTDKLGWGFVDHPPLSIAVLAALRQITGDSMFAIRIVPALLGAATIVMTALMARELGGGRVAQGLAGLAVLSCGVTLTMSNYYSMNAIDEALWPWACLLVLQILNGGSPRLWLGLGFVGGLGALNKVSMLWLFGGLAIGLVLTPARRWLRTPWPWAAGAITLAGILPFAYWQWRHDWAFLEFSRNAASYKVGAISLLAFIEQQALSMNPMSVPMAVAGLVYGFSSPSMRRYHPVLWIFVAVAAFLAATGSARPHYLAPAFPIVFAFGAVALERLGDGTRVSPPAAPGFGQPARKRARWAWVPIATAVAIAVGGLFSLPIAMPMMSPQATIEYMRLSGVRPLEERQRGGLLPMHLGLYFHAEAVLDAVGRVYAELSPEERSSVVILTRSFGETAALNVLGPGRGLPGSIGTHNQYWVWGPGEASGDPTLVLHDSEAVLRGWFESCERRAEIECSYCMEMMDAQSVWLCRHPRRPLRELWPEMKHFE